jgi:hypothetical protein
MEDLSKKLEIIISQSDDKKEELEQINKFEKTFNELQKIAPVEKPTYSLPQVDTLGRMTYVSLNQRS